MDPEMLQWNGVDYVPKAYCDALGNEIRRLEAATVILTEIAALVPLSETLAACKTGATLVQWFKANRARIKDAESIIGDISGDIAIFTDEMRGRIIAFLARSTNSGAGKHGG